MTAPTPPPEEPQPPTEPQPPVEPQPVPPPTSPQVAATEEALAASEDSLAPIIAAVLIAAILAGGSDDDDDLSLVTKGIIAKGLLFPPKWIAKTAAKGMYEYIRGILMLFMVPRITVRLQEMIVERHGYGYVPPFDVADIARQSATQSIDQAIESLDKYADTLEETDIYDKFDGQKGEDTRSKRQRQADAFGRKTARWIARDAIFGAQERIAETLGYTHKRWISERDNRVRPEHRLLDGEVAPLGDDFYTPTGKIRFPGDVTAPPHLYINCRCSLEWLVR